MRNFKLVALAVGIGLLGLYLMRRQEDPSLPLIRVNDEPSGIDAMIQKVASLFQPRGIRNNNPGNIERTGTPWQGMSQAQSDSRFIVFDSPEFGIRAMARILRTYMNRGQNTVASIINTWAPPTENDTSAYIAQVSAATGLDPHAQVTDAHLPAVIAAIIKHENGQQPYTSDVIARGVEMERMG